MGDDVITWMSGTRKKSAILIIVATSLSVEPLSTMDRRPRRARYQTSVIQEMICPAMLMALLRFRLESVDVEMTPAATLLS